MSNVRVVISGIGGLTPLGIEIAEHLESHQSGMSGLSDTDWFPYRAATVRKFDEKRLIPDRKSIRMMTRQCVLGVSSATLAIDDARVSKELLEKNDERNSVIYGSFYTQGVASSASPYLSCLSSEGDIDYTKLGNTSYRDFPPLWILPRLPNTTGGQISIQYGLRGISYSVVNGPAGGMIAAGEAMESIEDNRTDWVLAGASEMDPALDQVFRLDQQGLIANKTNANNGMFISEAGISYILERKEQVEKRGGESYAELASYHNSYVPNIMKLSHEERVSIISRHIFRCIEKSELTKDDIDVIQITGSGIPSLNRAEAEAVQRTLGSSVKIVCSTDYTGFSLGASGACSLFYALLQMKNHYLAPVLQAESHSLYGELAYVTEPVMDYKAQHLLCHHLDFLGNEVSLILSSGDQV